MTSLFRISKTVVTNRTYQYKHFLILHILSWEYIYCERSCIKVQLYSYVVGDSALYDFDVGQ